MINNNNCGYYNLQWLKEKIADGETLKYIYFWGHTNKQPNSSIDKSCFSQWYYAPFIVDDILYPTAEHWMMAQKALLFQDRTTFKQIIQAKSPGEAKDLGRRIVNFQESLWIQQRFELVKQGNIYKFEQNSEPGTYLLQTGDRILVEASPVDTIWGVGLSQDNERIQYVDQWKGLNLLGFALMEVRDVLRSENY